MSPRGYLEDSEIFTGDPESLADLEGWSSSWLLDSGTVPTPSSTKGSLQANFKKTGTYTVEFSLNLQVVPVGSNPYVQCLAEIIWSVKGNSVRRLISVTNGVAITGVGEGVRVVVSDNSSNAAGLKYLVSCQVAPGQRASTKQLPTLEIDNALVRGASPLQNIAAAATSTWTVPADSGINAVFISASDNGGGPAPDLSIQMNGGASILKHLPSDSLFTWIPLSPGTSSITIRNDNAFIADVTLTWGVEG